MKKKINFTIVVTTLVCLIPMVLGIIFWNKLPDELPINYGFNNEVGKVAPKWVNIILMPLFFVAMNMFLHISLSMKEKVGKKLLVFMKWIIPMLSVVVGSFMILKPLGLSMEASTLIIPLISFVLIVVGNYVPKTKPNYYVGYRLPWIINNEEVWIKTHRISGFLLVVCGFISFVTSFFSFGKYVFLVSMVIIIFIPLFYSLSIKRKVENNNAESSCVTESSESAASSESKDE